MSGYSKKLLIFRGSFWKANRADMSIFLSSSFDQGAAFPAREFLTAFQTWGQEIDALNRHIE